MVSTLISDFSGIMLLVMPAAFWPVDDVPRPVPEVVEPVLDRTNTLPMSSGRDR